MKEIIITTQDKLDLIKEVKIDEYLIIDAELRLNSILEVFGKVTINFKLDCSWDSRFIRVWENSSVVARENSSVVARENSSVVARGNSSVVAWENSSVVARGNSSVVAWGNSSVVARENSSVVAWGNSSVVARENSSVVARENSSVVAWENSSVVARENSSVEARENSCIRLLSAIKGIVLNGYSVCFLPFDLKIKIKKSKNVIIQKFKLEAYLDREGISTKNNKVILFKKVSSDFKTQENTKNETIWNVGTTLTHLKWSPTEQECGEGKYHACSRPYFCDEFRNNKGDRYIAIEIVVKDLYEWKNPQYLHKIAFRKGKVLYECDKFGKRIK